MGIRENIGGMIEDILNKSIDENLDGAIIKEQLHKMIDKFIDDKMEGIKQTVKEYVDKIDGEVDLK